MFDVQKYNKADVIKSHLAGWWTTVNTWPDGTLTQSKADSYGLSGPYRSEKEAVLAAVVEVLDPETCPQNFEGSKELHREFTRLFDPESYAHTIGMIPLSQAASQLGVSESTLRNQVANGKIHASKYGRDNFFDNNELQRYAAESRNQPGRRPGTQ